MRKALLPLLAICLASCGKITASDPNTFHIEEFVFAYETSEPRTTYGDIYLAHCEGGIYVEIPDDYYLTSIKLERTGKKIYYIVYDLRGKVSNKGWEYKQ